MIPGLHFIYVTVNIQINTITFVWIVFQNPTMLSSQVVKTESKLSPGLPESCQEGRGFQPWHKPATTTQQVRTTAHLESSVTVSSVSAHSAEASLFKYTNANPPTTGYNPNFFPGASHATNTYTDLTKGLGDTASALTGMAGMYARVSGLAGHPYEPWPLNMAPCAGNNAAGFNTKTDLSSNSTTSLLDFHHSNPNAWLRDMSGGFSSPSQLPVSATASADYATLGALGATSSLLTG